MRVIAMPKVRASFETGAATHVGLIRDRNEDGYLVRPEAGVWAVADGMGGHDDGDVASRTVIEALGSIDVPRSADELLSCCERRIFDANWRLKELSRQRGDTIIGTTVAVLLIFDDYFSCVWSGDSRIYVIRQSSIAQISCDHTEVQDLIARGLLTTEEAEGWRGSNAITRAVGVFDLPELEMRSGPVEVGDVFVLCTDGLTRHVQDTEIYRTVTNSAPQAACDQLIQLTLERGAFDNVTVIVARRGAESIEYDDGPFTQTEYRE
jgi:serine/threonine protein phosphatase PrpC